MLHLQHLYTNIETLEESFQAVDKTKECLIQIFTNSLCAKDSIQLASKLKEVYPQAKIIGSSVSGVIYRGEQYEDQTLICVEQYEHSNVYVAMMSYENKAFEQTAFEITNHWEGKNLKLLRMFVGGYYGYSHQLIDQLNRTMPSTQLAGGMSGELHQSKDIPFIFNETEELEKGLVMIGIVGEKIKTFHRINTSHTTVSDVHTVTEVKGSAIISIENTPAQLWLEQNLGFLSTKFYGSWEETAKRDPLVRFQIALESHPKAIRYVHYHEDTGQISQYFSRFPKGTKFRIGYTSPSKCVEEVKETTKLVASSSMETLFCYSCLFRKLYLKNCAQWELMPYHKNPVSGVFLLGEIGYDNGQNALLNGSCVLSGIGEADKYLEVDTNVFKYIENIEDDSQELLRFLEEKRNQVSSLENEIILDTVLSKESIYNNQTLIQKRFGFKNMFEYEADRENKVFNKIALIKIENADILISYMGQNSYYEQLYDFLGRIKKADFYMEFLLKLSHYILNNDTFVIATADELQRDEFIDFISRLEIFCKELQNKLDVTPFLLRFVVVDNNDYLLEEAYCQLQAHKDSQNRLVVSTRNEELGNNTKRELDSIKLIQYALTNDKVIPYYQGIYNNKTGVIDKYEALMRLADRDGNIYPPIAFMDASKKYRLYLDLNLKMCEKVLQDFNHLDLGININLSAHDISSSKFRYMIKKYLKNYSNPSNITFEIVEEDYVSDIEGLLSFIEEIRGYGAKIAVDDFGSGYSNLFEIIKMHPDFIKIDGKIVKAINTNEEGEILIDVIDSLGKKLNVDLVAEFVENKEIQDTLLKYNILYSQGYYFSKPAPIEEITKTK